MIWTVEVNGRRVEMAMEVETGVGKLQETGERVVELPRGFTR